MRPTIVIDQQNCRPDFLCPIYAAYLGEKNNDSSEVALGSEVKITKDMPPVFMSVTADDAYRGVQAASLFIELKRAGVPAELHVYNRGGHGYGIRPSGHPVDSCASSPGRLAERYGVYEEVSIIPASNPCQPQGASRG